MGRGWFPRGETRLWFFILPSRRDLEAVAHVCFFVCGILANEVDESEVLERALKTNNEKNIFFMLTIPFDYQAANYRPDQSEIDTAMKCYIVRPEFHELLERPRLRRHFPLFRSVSLSRRPGINICSRLSVYR